MRTAVLVVVGALVASLCWAGQGQGTVSNLATIVAPAAGSQAALAWVTNTAYVRNQAVKSQGRYFVCTKAGTSTNAAVTALPPTSGADVQSGTAWFRPAVPGTRGGCVVQCVDSNALLYVGMSPSLVAGAGTALGYLGTFVVSGSGCPQGAVYAVGSSTNTAYAVMEW